MYDRAVSYTHLDVYKRQILYQGSTTALAFNCLYNGFKGTFESEFLTSLLNRGGITTVSYTHLDVYKRQTLLSVILSFVNKHLRNAFSLK